MIKFPAAGSIAGIVFILCLATTIGGALLTVMTTRIIRSVCGLAMCSIGLAGLFYFLHSPFLALMEILIYVGAVCVTIVFAVMLAEPDEPLVTEKPSASILWGGLALLSGLVIFAGLWRLTSQTTWPTPKTVSDGSMEAIGKAMLTTFSMPFELISLALLVAILGALAIARTGKGRHDT
jgi:NADH-quinone oxidoreductase subunit J